MHRMLVGMRVPDLAEDTLRFVRQLGCDAVEVPTRYSEEATGRPSAPLLPPAQDGPAGPQPATWRVDELRRIRDRVEGFGLVAAAANLPLSGTIVLGRSGRDRDIETVCACIAAAGAAGIPVLRYTFRGLRPSAGYDVQWGGGRGSADVRDYDFARVRDLPPIPEIGVHTYDQMWERLTFFLRRAVPAAEAAGVRLACHPNDPPAAVFRGVAQPVATLDDMRRLLTTVDSVANSIVGHPGVFAELGEDPVAALGEFGAQGRIAFVHFRNVRTEIPYDRYAESFHDDGDVDLAACMASLYETAYTGMIDPDHVPGIAGDTADHRFAWAQAVGLVVGLRNTAEGVWGAAGAMAVVGGRA